MKLTKTQLSGLIKEEFGRQLRLSTLIKQKKSLTKDIKKLNEEFGDYEFGGRESGDYAPGTEFDRNSPWNREEAQMVECWYCQGTGIDPEDGDVCPKCNGTGLIEDEDDVEGETDDYDPDENM